MTVSSSVIALTGATGFIGRRLAARLAADGYRLRCLVRQSLTPHLAKTPGIDRIVGDLDDRAALVALVQGVDVVIHLAGAVRGATAADFHGPNVRGVANLLAAMADAAPQARLLHLSSLAAREPELSHYAASKRAGEELVRQSPLHATVIRPPAVYGPGDQELLPLLQGLLRGLGVIPGQPGRFALICVDDLVEAMLAWLAVSATEGGCYEIDDGHPEGYDWDQVIAALARLRGGPVRAIRVPRPVLASVASVGMRVMQVMGRAPMLSPGKVRELFHPDWTCDSSAFSAATGWHPRIDLDAGLRLTFGSGDLA